MRDVLIIAYEKQINLTKCIFNPLNANITKWSKTLKQFVGKLPTNCLSVFDHFVGVVLKGLIAKLDGSGLGYNNLNSLIFILDYLISRN